MDEYVSEGGFGPNCVHSTAYISPDFGPHQKLIEEQTGEAVVDEPQVVEFVPAKTVKEAEAWARDNIVPEPYTKEEWIDRVTGKVAKTVQKSNVTYKGLSIDSANEVNRTLGTLSAKGLPMPHKIVTKNFRTQTFDMRTSGHNLEVNSRFMKDADAVKLRAAELSKNTEAARESLPSLRAAEAAGKLDQRGRALLAEAERSLKYKRMSVGETVGDIATHEVGHMLELRGQSSFGVGISKDAAFKDWRKRVGVVRDEMMSDKHIFGLSYYPETTRMYGQMPAEVFAESFAAYMKGEGANTLGPKTMQFFKGLGL